MARGCERTADHLPRRVTCLLLGLITSWAIGCAADHPKPPPGAANTTSTTIGAATAATSATTASTTATTTPTSTATSASAPAEPPVPYFQARSHAAEYAGPGREIPPPTDVDEIRIAWFGPSDASHPTAGPMWQAAQLAIEEANAAGGYDGRLFRLLPSWSENPWGSGIERLTRHVYEGRVWAVTGAPDGPSAHLVEQVVAKARLSFVSPVSTDKTANLVNVPWIFSCAPSDDMMAPVLAEAVARCACDAAPAATTPAAQSEPASVKPVELVGENMRRQPTVVSSAVQTRIALASCTDHDSRVFLAELLTALADQGVFPACHVQFSARPTDVAEQLDRIRSVRPAALILIADAPDSAQFLLALRHEGLRIPVFGGPKMAKRVFHQLAGGHSEGVVLPLLWAPSEADQPAAAFVAKFRQRFGADPDYTAAYTYDAMNLLIAAVRQAGLNRALIRDALRMASPWQGVTGAIAWDPTGQNCRPVHLGVFHEGRLQPYLP